MQCFITFVLMISLFQYDVYHLSFLFFFTRSRLHLPARRWHHLTSNEPTIIPRFCLITRPTWLLSGKAPSTLGMLPSKALLQPVASKGLLPMPCLISFITGASLMFSSG